MIFDMTKRKGGGGNIVPKTINANGTYDASQLDNADGYSPVTVNVPTGIQPPATGWLPTSFANLSSVGVTLYGTNLMIPRNFMRISSYPSALLGVRSIICDENCTITTIDQRAFAGLANLELIKIRYDASLQIYGYVFESCPRLTTVYILSKRATPSTNVALGVNLTTTITDLYVPWGEGEVVGAPWGATNATIHYNYTED